MFYNPIDLPKITSLDDLPPVLMDQIITWLEQLGEEQRAKRLAAGPPAGATIDVTLEPSHEAEVNP